MHFTLVQNGSAIITSEQNFPKICLCVFPGLQPQLAHSASLISSAWSAPSDNASWANSLTMIADKTPVAQRCNNLLARPDWGFVAFSKACCVFSKTEGLEVFCLPDSISICHPLNLLAMAFPSLGQEGYIYLEQKLQIWQTILKKTLLQT